MDPKALEKAFEIYPDVRVVVLAHLYGTPGKMDEIMEVIHKHNAILVEDAQLNQEKMPHGINMKN